MRARLILPLLLLLLAPLAGCHLVLPEITHRPVIRNPFPQLHRVAIAPFFNHSDEPTLDGRDFSMAYFSELQATPGFDVVPLNVVEEAIITHQVDLSGPGEARRLAQLLGVDAVVVGAVTDYRPYYPPRCGLRVEWYTANPGYHQIPAGYGLPWNTPEEEFIPDELVYASQMALVRAQMAAQAPDCEGACQLLPAPPESVQGEQSAAEVPNPFVDRQVKQAQAIEKMPAGDLTFPEGEGSESAASEESASSDSTSDTSTTTALPQFKLSEENSPQPEAAEPVRPECIPFAGPVLEHTNIYLGTDPDVTEALRSYAYFRDDARFGGWESYLQRSDDFIRFCCHMHISEMLSARGGSRKTRVVWRWPDCR